MEPSTTKKNIMLPIRWTVWRERVAFLNNVAVFSVAVLNYIFFRNKDPGNIFRLMCLRI